MDEVIATDYSAFDAFRPHFNALARVGYFKIVMRPLSRIRYALFEAYRMFVWIAVIMYNLQHIMRVVKDRHNTDRLVDTLFILLTTLNTLGKQLSFNLRSRRIDHIISVINGPKFAPKTHYHTEVMKKNAVTMRHILLFYQASVFGCGALWTIFPLVNKALGIKVEFTAYFPFDTTTSPAFDLAHAYMSILITVQAYAHVTMDCTIAAFYAQAKLQLQMFRYNLEHVADFDNRIEENGKDIDGRDNHNDTKYRRDRTDLAQKKLVNCVQHHQLILWFVKEVQSLFAEALIFQFFVTAWIICMTVYKIVGLSLLSVEFISMANYLGCMLAQLFIYCYYGTQVSHESGFVNQSVYCCDWLSVAPKFRRQLILVMEKCSRTINLRVAYVVPISLNTYITVLRASYTLFTFLDRK